MVVLEVEVVMGSLTQDSRVMIGCSSLELDERGRTTKRSM